MMRLPGGKAGERELKRIQKKVQTRQTSSELGVTEAWVKKMEKDVAALKNAAKGEDSRVDKLWKWMQEERRREK